MTTHARLSPSARYRWQLCPASVEASAAKQGNGKSSPASIDGTHSHTLLEHCIKNAPKGSRVTDPKQFIGTLLQDHEGMFGVDKDRADRVRVATDYIAARLKELSAEAFVYAETRVNPAGLLGRDDMSGTVDVQIIDGTFIEVIDYKDGMNPVEAKDNPQLEQYAFGVLSESMTVGRLVTDFRLTIIQPKIALKGGNPITSFDLSATEMLGERMEKIIAEANATDAKDAPFVPGDKQCAYCPASGSCKAAVTHNLEKSGVKFENMNFAVEASDQQPTEMTDAELAELVTSGPLLRKLIDAAEEEALRRITTGHPVEGLKVVRGPGRRIWSKPEEDIALALKRMRVPTGLIHETKVISPASAEKLSWLNKAGATVTLSAKQQKVLHEEMMARTEGKLTVVPVADKREAERFDDPVKLFGPVEAAPVVPEMPSWLS